MGLRYTKMPIDAFGKLVINAGILLRNFNPADGSFSMSDIIGATSGGLAFATNPTYNDFGEDVDNCPPNTKQMKRISYYDPSCSGTFLTVSPATIASQVGAADVDGEKVTPRAQLKDEDFHDLWMVGDYSDVNTGESAGFLAIHLMDTLNTTGFQIQTGKDAKGTSSFEYHAHYDMEDEEQTPPFEIYCKAGTETGGTPSIRLSDHTITIADEATFTLTAIVRNSSSAVTWTTGSSSVATVAGGVVTGEGAGSTIITASITEDGVTYTDTCTVIVTA